MEADDELPLSEEERARRAARELLAEIGKKLLRRVWGTGWRRDEGRECGSVGRAEAHPEVRSVWFITFKSSRRLLCGGGAHLSTPTPSPPSEWHTLLGGRPPPPQSMTFSHGGSRPPPLRHGIESWGVRTSPPRVTATEFCRIPTGSPSLQNAEIRSHDHKWTHTTHLCLLSLSLPSKIRPVPSMLHHARATRLFLLYSLTIAFTRGACKFSSGSHVSCPSHWAPAHLTL